MSAWLPKNQYMGLRATCAMTMVNSYLRYWQKINFLTIKMLLFLHVVKMGNENGMLFKQVFEVKITLQASSYIFLVKY